MNVLETNEDDIREIVWKVSEINKPYQSSL